MTGAGMQKGFSLTRCGGVKIQRGVLRYFQVKDTVGVRTMFVNENKVQLSQ